MAAAMDWRAAGRRAWRLTVLFLFVIAAILAAVGYVIGWGIDAIVFVQSPAGQAWVGRIGPSAAIATLFAELFTQVNGPGLAGACIAFAAAYVLCSVMILAGDRVILRTMDAERPQAGDVQAQRARELLAQVSIAAGIPAPRLVVVETEVANAFAVGIWDESRAVGVTRGLLGLLDERELRAVLAHEVGHLANGDLRLSCVVVVTVGMLVVLAAPIRGLLNAFDIFGWSGGSRSSSRSGSSSSEKRDGGGGAAVVVIIAIVLFMILVVGLAPLPARIAQYAIGREREFNADAASARLTRDAPALASALGKIAGRPTAMFGQDYHPCQALCFEMARHERDSIFATHPPIRERISRLLGRA
ncbi:MAG: M48 family metalloprotease [Alphaproteobacteria bacterium]|nr:M48 family metalloprotease [Alphaproteobacteria bacterium]